MMRAFAVKSSHRMEKGNTSTILDPLISGMNHVGAEIDSFLLKNMEVRSCDGDFQRRSIESVGTSSAFRNELSL